MNLLRVSASLGYAANVRGYLVPYLGDIGLAELSPPDGQGMFTAIIRGDAALGRPVSAVTLRRIQAMLRPALNAAVRAGLTTSNPVGAPSRPQSRGRGRRVDASPDSAVGAGGLTPGVGSDDASIAAQPAFPAVAAEPLASGLPGGADGRRFASVLATSAWPILSAANAAKIARVSSRCSRSSLT